MATSGRFSLKTLLSAELLSMIPHNQPCVMLVDPHTSRVLSSAARMFDLMNAGVVVIQNILIARESLDMPAVYFLSPTQESVQALINDFTSKHQQYSSVYLYFTGRVKNSLTQLVANNEELMKRIQKFIELNVDWIALESRIFTFDRQHSLTTLYTPRSQDELATELSITSRQLVSLCLSLNELPFVRYGAGVGKSALSQGLATFFDEDMKKAVTKSTDWKANEKRQRGTLLIVDRGVDVVAPFMHEFTYQAMATDLLRIKGELAYLPDKTTSDTNGRDFRYYSSFTAPGTEPDCVLSEDDSLWIDLRHKHIADVMRTLNEQFREFKNKSKAAQFQSADKLASVSDMAAVMRELPQYKSMIQQFSKHMAVAEECMNRMNRRKLPDVGELEQDLAAGVVEDGRPTDMKLARKRLLEFCQDPTLTTLEKLRLIGIFIASQGSPPESLKRELFRGIDPILLQAFRNMERLGLNMADAADKPRQSLQRMKEAVARSAQYNMRLMRYVPVLMSVMESLVLNELDTTIFPYLSPPPEDAHPVGRRGISRRKPKPGDWRAQSGPDDEDDVRPLLIVFVLGGLTFSEARSCYEIANKHGANLLIGSSSMLTPAAYVADLSAVNSMSRFKLALGAEQSAPNADDEVECDSDVTTSDQISLNIDTAASTATAASSSSSS